MDPFACRYASRNNRQVFFRELPQGNITPNSISPGLSDEAAQLQPSIR
jgi:hypothetical protein